MLKIFLYVIYFGFLAGVGIILGCYIHGVRVNQPTLMSGVAFVREMPQGERIVGFIETTVFSYEEKKSLEDYKKRYEGQIKIDPDVLKEQQKLYRDGAGGK
jgi:hypothetical protein